ncbi:MAG: hypothetical protein ACJ71W_21660 [Terriglobales bacterium]
MKRLIAIALLMIASLCHGQTLPEAPKPHRFMDRANRGLITASAATIVGDALSGDHVQAYINFPGQSPEMNPVARPFMNSRVGVGFYFAASFATEVGLMYWLHRHGHHRLERILPLGVTATETYWTVSNYKIARQLDAIYKP